jgi:monoamine oxidase
MTELPMLSCEGYLWTEAGGQQQGLPTTATVHPSIHFHDDQGSYDTIVIGAGYAGLSALRDLTLAGFNVLLLEARDRIGGRTWTATIDGHNYELGGTYIHWAQPSLWREIARYQMQKDVDAATDLQKGLTEISLTTSAGSRSMSQEEQVSVLYDS